MLFSGKVKNILKNKSGEKAIMEIDNLLSPIFYTNPEKLSAAEKNIVYIEELEREVNNGGFNQFFFNSAGNYTNELVNALKLIGSVKFLQIVESAISQFPNSVVPANWAERQNLVNEIDEDDSIWNALDQEFYKYEEDIYKLMIEYINRNIKDFR